MEVINLLTGRERPSRKLSEIVASLGTTAFVAVLLLVEAGFVLLAAVLVMTAVRYPQMSGVNRNDAF
ncbi:hypothetical protein O7606_26055 [Micromonospora sp. WMMD882]|uniref:hypothetical protein n=1 Tax=Micromonospora sp. WMMD882 TaxID=3015151 RepID=UPI00248AA230|nr:hypothetical protein [Micromonospora sp. WMMD882]WBB79572.1 hypothetical protein O7606_26055 [Micromonospora sp. WMMD882]